MNLKRVIGLVLSLTGIIFLLISINGVTGFVITNNFSITNNNLTTIGLLLVIIGIVLFEFSFKKFR